MDDLINQLKELGKEELTDLISKLEPIAQHWIAEHLAGGVAPVMAEGTTPTCPKGYYFNGSICVLDVG